MIDIHCHILPAVDDGSPNWTTTAEMCRVAAEDGITHVVATPHADSRYAYDRSSHGRALDELRRLCPELQFTLGCDFHLTEQTLGQVLAQPSLYTIGGTPYLLVEFNDHQTPRQMLELIGALDDVGLRPIVTHPERNLIIAQYRDLAEQLVSAGALLQITASSLTGDWGRSAKKMCEQLIARNQTSFIASDAHDNKRRPPILSKARKAAARIAGGFVAGQLTEENQSILLEGVFV